MESAGRDGGMLPEISVGVPLLFWRRIGSTGFGDGGLGVVGGSVGISIRPTCDSGAFGGETIGTLAKAAVP